VVKRDDPEHIIGLITRKSLMNAYNLALERRNQPLPG
jgi:hypothetical protein